MLWNHILEYKFLTRWSNLQIDKEGAEPDRVMQELSGIGLLPEDWGGDVPMIQVIMLIVLRYSSGAIINLFSKSTYLGIFSD